MNEGDSSRQGPLDPCLAPSFPTISEFWYHRVTDSSTDEAVGRLEQLDMTETAHGAAFPVGAENPSTKLLLVDPTRKQI